MMLQWVYVRTYVFLLFLVSRRILFDVENTLSNNVFEVLLSPQNCVIHLDKLYYILLPLICTHDDGCGCYQMMLTTTKTLTSLRGFRIYFISYFISDVNMSLLPLGKISNNVLINIFKKSLKLVSVRVDITYLKPKIN